MQRITFNPEVSKRQKAGLDTVANAVKVTIGPRGKNVLIHLFGSPQVTNDGGIIGEAISLKDPDENAGAEIIKGVIRKTSREVGGGRTASAILMQSIVDEGTKYSEKGMSMLNIKKGMDLAVEDITQKLVKNARPVKTRQQIKQIATISTESVEFGEIIAQTLEKVGKNSIVSVEESQTFGVTVDFVEGLEFNKGYVSPYMLTDFTKMEAVYKDVDILVTSKTVSFNDLLLLVAEQTPDGWMPIRKNLVVICEEIDDESLDTVIQNRMDKRFQFLVIKAPAYGEVKRQWLEDIAAVTGAKLVDEFKDFKPEVLGKAKKIISRKDYTRVFGSANIKSYIATLNKQPEPQKERIARLLGGIAVIKVGGAGEQETGYLKKKIEDGVSEAKRALEEGVVVGGDIAFINAVKSLKPKAGVDELSIGYNLILKAVEAPFRQIIKNGNGEAEVILSDIKKSSSNTIGYDALENILVEDMFRTGIIDALKVVRTVLINAVSSAYMFLTIEVGIVVEPEQISTE